MALRVDFNLRTKRVVELGNEKVDPDGPEVLLLRW